MENIIFDITEENIKKAADKLKNGGLVAFPTETVYGLGADATQDSAVAGIFDAKGRPQFNPLIVHFADIEDAETEVYFNDKARALAKVFCPGSLTMILPRKEGSKVSYLCSAGLDSIAVRVPNHKVARDLIKELGKPIAAPSANRSGSLSPTDAHHVFKSLGLKAGMILDGGRTEVGLESTVVDMTGDVPTLLRPGFITKDDLDKVIGEVKVEIEVVNNNPKSPGQLLKHYAPNTPVRLNALDTGDGEVLLGFGDIDCGENDLNLSSSGNLHEAAANLFAMLHQLDKGGYKAIAVMPIPNHGLGLAINDRLKRAAEK